LRTYSEKSKKALKEPRIVFFSLKQIEQSISRLSEVNPFFGTSFLAFKKDKLPVGTTKILNFSQIVEDILQIYYRPKPDFSGFYTPFKTSDRNKRWNAQRYGSTTLQRITTDTFSDVLVHSKGSREWGWKSDYIMILSKNHLSTSLIPAFDLAVWLFREKKWDESVQGVDVIEFFLKEFNITYEERELFDTSIPLLANLWLQARPISTTSLLSIIGVPPGSIMEEGATLELLKLSGIGPVTQIECRFAQRLNLITGDNGLGKTFLLECAWWALTGTWAGYQAYPRQDAAKRFPSIAFQIGENSQSDKIQTVRYNWDRQDWDTPANRNVLPGLSIFSQADGSFAIWDPAKYPLLEGKREVEGISEALIRFSRTQVWDGIEGKQGNRTIPLSNGLIRDWVAWQTSDSARFEELSATLKALSPHSSEEPLIPGQPTRLPPDARRIPTLKFSYGEVPIVLCSATATTRASSFL
jgi:AAA domain